MRTRLALSDKPFAECSTYEPLMETTLAKDSIRCFRACDNVLFHTNEGIEIYATVWNSTTNQYIPPVQLINGTDAVTCTDQDHPACYRIINTNKEKDIEFKFTKILTSSGETKNYYANLEKVNKFKIQRYQDKIVTLTYINNQLDFSVNFNNKQSECNILKDGSPITSPLRIVSDNPYEFTHIHCFPKTNGTKCKTSITIDGLNCSKSPKSCQSTPFLATIPAKDRIFNFNQELIDNNVKDYTKLIIILVVVGIILIAIIIGIILLSRVRCLYCKICICCTKCLYKCCCCCCRPCLKSLEQEQGDLPSDPGKDTGNQSNQEPGK